MATLTELREGVANALRAIPGLQASATVLSNPSPPIAYVLPGEINYHRTMTGHTDWNLIIEVQAGGFLDQGAQAKMDAFLDDVGTTSIRQAVEADPTLGGTAEDLIVQGVRNYGKYTGSTGDVLGAQILVWVLAGN